MKTILIVDDNQIYTNTLKDTLEKGGYKILTAEDGNKGFSLASTNNPDLIILDIIMPEKNGLLVLEDLKKLEETKNIPIIVSSDYPGVENLIKEFNNINYVLKSEISNKELLAKIEKILN